MKTKTITSSMIIVLATVFLCISHSAVAQSQLKKEELIGMRLKGYDEKRALQDKLGFWSGARSFYGEDNKMVIERWENQKTKELWLVLVEELDTKESVICDVLTYSLNSIVDIGPFEIYDTKNKKNIFGLCDGTD